MAITMMPRGNKTNHKKGIASAKKAKKREEAEARNASYREKIGITDTKLTTNEPKSES